MANYKIEWVFMAWGSLAKILFKGVFDRLKSSPLRSFSFNGSWMDFRGQSTTWWICGLHLTLVTKPLYKTIRLKILVVDFPYVYNVILKRLTLNKLGTMISPLCIWPSNFSGWQLNHDNKGKLGSGMVFYNANLLIAALNKKSKSFLTRLCQKIFW